MSETQVIPSQSTPGSGGRWWTGLDGVAKILTALVTIATILQWVFNNVAWAVLGTSVLISIIGIAWLVHVWPKRTKVGVVLAVATVAIGSAGGGGAVTHLANIGEFDDSPMSLGQVPAPTTLAPSPTRPADPTARPSSPPTPSALPSISPTMAPTGSPAAVGIPISGPNANPFIVASRYVNTSTRDVRINGESFRFGYVETGSCYGCNQVTEAYVNIDLGRDYHLLTARLGLTDDSRAEEPVRFEIFADGTSIYDETWSLGESDDVELVITGVLRLRFVFTGRLQLRNVIPAVGDPMIYTSAGPEN